MRQHLVLRQAVLLPSGLQESRQQLGQQAVRLPLARQPVQQRLVQHLAVPAGLAPLAQLHLEQQQAAAAGLVLQQVLLPLAHQQPVGLELQAAHQLLVQDQAASGRLAVLLRSGHQRAALLLSGRQAAPQGLAQHQAVLQHLVQVLAVAQGLVLEPALLPLVADSARQAVLQHLVHQRAVRAGSGLP